MLLMQMKNIIHKYFKCKYAIKKKNVINSINEELDLDKSDDVWKNNNHFFD